MGGCASLATSGEDRSLALYSRDPFLLFDAWNFPIGTSVTISTRGQNSMIAGTIGEDLIGTVTTTVTENDKHGVIMERSMTTNGRRNKEALVEIPRAQPHNLGADMLSIGPDSYECQVGSHVMHNGNTRTTWDSWGHPVPLQIRVEATDSQGSSETIVATASSIQPDTGIAYGHSVSFYPYDWKIYSPTAGQLKVHISSHKAPDRREIDVTVVVESGKDFANTVQAGLGNSCCIMLQVGTDRYFTTPAATCEDPMWNQSFTFSLSPEEGDLPNLEVALVTSEANPQVLAEGNFMLRILKLENAELERWLPLLATEEEPEQTTLWACPEIPGWGCILLPSDADVVSTFESAGQQGWKESTEDQYLGMTFQLLTKVNRVQNVVVKQYGKQSASEARATALAKQQEGFVVPKLNPVDPNSMSMRNLASHRGSWFNKTGSTFAGVNQIRT